MFQKPTFGSTAAGFGSFNSSATSSSPFGGFKAPTQSAFGAAPSFSANTSQPTNTGGLFGAPSTTGGLFGASTSTAAAPGFGATVTGAGGGLFAGAGAGAGAGGGLFGATQQPGPFGAKPPAFGFGATSTPGTSGNVFGTTQQANTGLFGQQPTSMLAATNTGLFGGATTSFGGQPTAGGTGHVKYSPVVGTDVMVKSGTSQNINIKHNCITCMKEYENKSLEELRLEDYLAGRNKGTTASANAMFSGFHTDNKPLFNPQPAFGQAASTSAGGAFGGGISTGAFSQPNTFSFGNNTQNANTGTSLFGANKPAFGSTPAQGTGLFGATATTQAPAFGTNTSTFGFGSNTQNQSTGLFGAKPAQSGFGATPASSFSGFGANTSGGLFGGTQAQPAMSAQQPTAFGAGGAFGTSAGAAAAGAGGGLFASPFNKAAFPLSTQPANTQMMPTGLGSTLGNSFGVKPGGLGTGTGLFGANTQPTTSLNFNTGTSGLGGGLGGFGNTSTLGNTSLGGMTNFGMANTGLGNQSLSGSAVSNVHEQILTLAARPYGDEPLYKHLLPDSTTSVNDSLKPTNPGALQAVLQQKQYRVGSTNSLPRAISHTNKTMQKSLFDGLEESDPSLEDALTLKASRKRLVLRPQTHGRDHTRGGDAATLRDHRSHEDTHVPHTEPTNKCASRDAATDVPRTKETAGLRGVNTDLEDSSDRHSSWLGSSKLPWNDSKEKTMDNNEATPRLYPDIDKDLQSQMVERRSSWLKTKPLRKPVTISSQDTSDNTIAQLAPETRTNVDRDPDDLSVSEEENVAPREAPLHPTGVKLTRPGYYTIPALDDMISYIRPDGRCVVPHLTIGRKNYGNVFYDCEIDVTGMDLDSLVHFLNKEVIIYPDESVKPPVGSGLNRRAAVTLDRVWPRDKTNHTHVTDVERLQKMEYEGKLRRVCDKHDTKFIEYRPQTGSWVFRVEHFSKYGLTDSDEEDDITPEVLKRQLATQALQMNAAPAQSVPQLRQSVGLGGLTAPNDSIDNLYAIQQTSLNLLGNGVSRGLEMDTTEDHPEMHSLYSDTEKVFELRSPSSSLARLERRHTHHVQLMKASLIDHAETMEDDASVSTEDQRVPAPRAPLVTASLSHGLASSASLSRTSTLLPLLATADVSTDGLNREHAGEVILPTLKVPPHTIVLKYHRKVPPFKQTIAGRLSAACLASPAVSRARHSRVGHASRGRMLCLATTRTCRNNPQCATLDELCAFVRGRLEDDWSDPLVVTLSLTSGEGSGTAQITELYTRYLTTLVSLSTITHSGRAPLLAANNAPAERLKLLQQMVALARDSNEYTSQFGVSGAYWCDVWTLCEALWAADLHNDGIPATDEQSIVNRHNKLIEWLMDVAADGQTDGQGLAKCDIDEPEGECGRVVALVSAGHLVEACRVARTQRDYTLAALIAQGGGDATFRSLLQRQLSQWSSCGATAVLSAARTAAMRLVAGLRDRGHHRAWRSALLHAARYYCPQIPSLEQVVSTFERSLQPGSDPGAHDEDAERPALECTPLADDVTWFPSPPYCEEYAVDYQHNGSPRRMVDLRYELIRGRAFNSRPRIQPAAYTHDPMDFSLCFLVSAWFGNVTGEIVGGYCHQLEARGAWHLAVVVAAYHPDDRAREYLIKELLSRHAPSSADSQSVENQLSMIRRVEVPDKWIREAQAYRAQYEKKWSLACEHLCAAGIWNAAHNLMLEQLLPKAVLADEFDVVAPLLANMKVAADRNEISGWDRGGLALYHYIQVCTEMRDIVSAGDQLSQSQTEAKMESLRCKVAAIAQLPLSTNTESAVSLACGAAMCARAQCLCPTLSHTHTHAHTQHTHRIATELAERAAMCCAELSHCSPLPSRRSNLLEGQS